jgi:hypothetical protein
VSDPKGPTGAPVPPEDDAVRRLLRGLPEVAPPEGFFDDLIRRRRRRARAIAMGGIAAAGVVGAIVVAQATGIHGVAEPAMGDLTERHEEAMTVPASEVPGEMPADEVPAPYQAPEQVGGMQRGMAVWHADDVVQVVYAANGHYVSVFEQIGDLDPDAMTVELTPAEVDGVDAWWAEGGALVVRRREVVYVIVGDLDPDEVRAVVVDLPDARPMGLTRRIGDAMDDLVTAFGLG